MSNKHTVEVYMDAFSKTDKPVILSLLTDDVIWEMPGFYRHEGIVAFEKEIHPPHADGSPDIRLTRLIEEADIVVAEGTVKAKMKGGQLIDAVFCDVFHFRDGKISQLTSYVMFLNQPAGGEQAAN
jgi:ketosteroid isomerase-like protein